MALKNAFEGLATDSGLKRILNLLTFARDSSDRIRVVVDNQPAVTSLTYNRNSIGSMNGDTSTTWQSGTSWNVLDGREPLKMQHAQRADFVKRNRWTY